MKLHDASALNAGRRECLRAVKALNKCQLLTAHPDHYPHIVSAAQAGFIAEKANDVCNAAIAVAKAAAAVADAATRLRDTPTENKE